MNMSRLLIKLFSLALVLNVSTLSAAPVLWVGDSSGTLGTVDVATGNVAVIGSMGTVMTDIAFDPSGNLYGITFTSLYSIDKDTAASTLIGNTGIISNSLVFGSDGTLYTANNSLYTIDTITGSSTIVGNGGDPYSSSGDLAFIGGELYLSSVGGDDLFKLDTGTGVGTEIGNIGFGAVYGLATDNNIDLYGTTGITVLSVDVTTGAGTALVNYGGQGLGSANGSAFLEEAAVVPVPAAVWLFGSGLLGLVGIARRKKSA